MMFGTVRGRPVWRVPTTQMLAYQIKTNLRERSHLGDIINVQFDIHLAGREKEPTAVALGTGTIGKTRSVNMINTI